MPRGIEEDGDVDVAERALGARRVGPVYERVLDLLARDSHGDRLGDTLVSGTRCGGCSHEITLFRSSAQVGFVQEDPAVPEGLSRRKSWSGLANGRPTGRHERESALGSPPCTRATLRAGLLERASPPPLSFPGRNAHRLQEGRGLGRRSADPDHGRGLPAPVFLPRRRPAPGALPVLRARSGSGRPRGAPEPQVDLPLSRLRMPSREVKLR